MTFKDNLINRFRKINHNISIWYQRYKAKRAKEYAIREQAKIDAEPIYWQEREKIIKEQEKIKAKVRARVGMPRPDNRINTPINTTQKTSNYVAPKRTERGVSEFEQVLFGTKPKDQGRDKEVTMANFKFI